VRAVGEVGDGEGRGDGADVEAELVAGAVDLADGDPEEEHLDADPIQGREAAGRGGAGDAGVVAHQPRARQQELARAREVHLEAAVGAELVPRHALREDAPREVVPLQHLVRRRGRRRRGVTAIGGEQEKGGEQEAGGLAAAAGHWFLVCADCLSLVPCWLAALSSSLCWLYFVQELAIGWIVTNLSGVNRRCSGWP
jgi:hypothetical protein